MNIDVLTYSENISPELVKNKTCVVIDVFRATTSLLTLLDKGASEITIMNNADGAYQYKNIDYFVGEKNRLKIKGFDFGNSPFELSQHNFTSKKVAIITTNGTHALKYVENSKAVFLGAFVNLNVIINYLITFKADNVVLLCSGSKGIPAIEDDLCAGAIISGLKDRLSDMQVSDRALSAMNLYDQHKNHLESYLAHSASAKKLSELGFKQDVEYCLSKNLYEVLATYKNGQVCLINEVMNQ